MDTNLTEGEVGSHTGTRPIEGVASEGRVEGFLHDFCRIP